MRPSPPQSRHSVTWRPAPPQLGQVTENCSSPVVTDVFPTPPQRLHGVSREPTRRPFPLHTVQGDLRRTLIVVFRPRMESSKLKEIWYSRSWPRSGCRDVARLRA